MRTLLPLLLFATPLFAQQDEVKQLRAEIEALRAEKNAIQDHEIAQARKFDAEKRRLLDEKEQLQMENARLAKELAEAKSGLPTPAPRKDPLVKKPDPARDPAPGSPEARFETTLAAAAFDVEPLGNAAGSLAELAGCPVVTEGEVEGLTIALRAPRLSLRALLDLMAWNTRNSAGDLVDMEWKVIEGKVVLRRKE